MKYKRENVSSMLWAVLFSMTSVAFVSGCGHPGLRHQIAVATTPPANATWLKGSEGADSDSYQWLTRQSYFCLASSKVQKVGNNWLYSGIRRPVIVDENTGRQRPLTILTKLLGAGENSIFNHTWQWRASPNGKWLVFLTHDTPRQEWVAVSTDGKLLVRRTASLVSHSADCVAWLPDSRRWAEVVGSRGKYQIILYSLDTSHSKTYPLTLSKDFNQTYFYDPGIVVLGFTSSNVLLTKGIANDGYSLYYELTLSGTRAFGTLLPRKEATPGFLLDVVLSPDGRRLAWRSANQSLCVSSLDGSGEHIVAGQIDGINTVRWVPDNKKISFRFNYSLYTTPVD